MCLFRSSKLKKSPKNVRKVPHTKADIKALAASINALGMLQYPVVEPEIGPRGKPYPKVVGAGTACVLVSWAGIGRCTRTRKDNSSSENCSWRKKDGLWHREHH